MWDCGNENTGADTSDEENCGKLGSFQKSKQETIMVQLK